MGSYNEIIVDQRSFLFADAATARRRPPSLLSVILVVQVEKSQRLYNTLPVRYGETGTIGGDNKEKGTLSRFTPPEFAPIVAGRLGLFN